MTTRSGKSYLPPHICRKCKEFYGYEAFEWQCSFCSGHAPPELDVKVREAACAEWVRENTLAGKGAKQGKALRKSLARLSDPVLYSILALLKKKGIYLAAADAVKLLGSIRRGHIVASAVGDWWNIKTAHVGGAWPSYLVCYYGQFDSSFYPVHPKPRNREILHCTETASLRLLHLPGAPPAPGFLTDGDIRKQLI